MLAATVVLAGSAVLSLLAARAVERYAHQRGMIDHPGERRSHDTPTPRGGGAAIVIAMVTGVCALVALGELSAGLAGIYLFGVCAMALLGWIDDHHSLSARVRLATQFLVAATVLYLLGGLPVATLGPLSIGPEWLRNALALLALVWMINLFNFMDGINGLAAMESAFAGAAVAVLAWAHGFPDLSLLAALTAMTCIGFLPWNFPRARLFMGDVGSSALGMGLGILFLLGSSSGTVPIATSLLILALFASDATATLVWRFIKGDQWYTAHTEHAYQRLVKRGASHWSVTTGALAINLLFIIPLLLWSRTEPGRQAVALVACYLGLLLVWQWTRTFPTESGRDS